MEKETKKKDYKSYALLGLGIVAGAIAGYAVNLLIVGIFSGFVIGLGLAWFVRLRGS